METGEADKIIDHFFPCCLIEVNIPIKSHALLTENEKNNCFSTWTRSDLNKIRKNWQIRKIRKLRLSRIFRYGKSQVYHFANNNLMAQNETVKTFNCFLTWEEKLRFVTFCMMTFFRGSMGDKISWDTTLIDFNWLLYYFFSVVFLWLSKRKWSCYPPTRSKQCCAAIRARESVEDTNLKRGV